MQHRRMSVINKYVNRKSEVKKEKQIDMKNVDLDKLFYLFLDFTAGADIDDVFNEYGHLDLEKAEDREVVINVLKKHYEENFDDFQKDELRVLIDYLIKEDVNIDRQIDCRLYPFDFPKDKQSFFREIKQALRL